MQLVACAAPPQPWSSEEAGILAESEAGLLDTDKCAIITQILIVILDGRMISSELLEVPINGACVPLGVQDCVRFPLRGD